MAILLRMHDPREYRIYQSELSAIVSSIPGLSITNKSLKERQRIYMYMSKVLVPRERPAVRHLDTIRVSNELSIVKSVLSSNT